MMQRSIDEAMSKCDRRLDAGDVRGAVVHLVEDLAATRSACSPDEWREIVADGRAHPLHQRLREDPYVCAAFQRPRGYPGDAHTIDFVYGYRQPDPDVTPLGRALLSLSTDVPIARAVRARCDRVAESIRALAARVQDGVVVSVACGHMRELHAVVDVARELRFVGIDQDPVTVQTVPALHPRMRVDAIPARIRALITGEVEMPDADLIYASGLYDYLDDRVAVVLTRALVAHLRPGGTILIPNLTPANDEIAYMEAVADWWMTYRTPAQMSVLAAASAGDTHLATSIHTIGNGRVACVEARRAELGAVSKTHSAAA